MSRTDALDASTRRDVETFLDRLRVEHDVPGASVAVLDGDAILHTAGLGARDVEAKAPATPETRYPFASVTKLVTAMVVLQLVERGEVALDDEICEYVSVWSDVPGDPITVADLLTHSSGMPADEGGERNYLFSEDPPASPLVTREDTRRHYDGVADQRITDEDRFMYSDTGYAVLGRIVEAVDGRPFAEVVERDLFDPLGMDDSTIGYGELSEMDDAITGYTIDDGTPTPTEFDLDADGEGLGPASPGGLLAPVTDVARVVRCLVNGGELDGTRVLDAELVEATCSHQAPTLEIVGGPDRGCGYGPRITEFVGERFAEHSGTAPGVGRAYAGFFPERELGVTLGVNTADVPIAALGQGVLALVLGEDPEEVVSHLSLREKVRAVAGTYESPRGSTTVTIEPSDSEAYVEATNEAAGWSFPAFPESVARDDYSFYAVWPAGLRQPLDFHDSPEGMELRLSSHRLRRTHVTD